jgi:hypothetical protein
MLNPGNMSDINPMIYAPYEMKIIGSKDGLCYGSQPIHDHLLGNIWSNVKARLPKDLRNEVYWSLCRILRALDETSAEKSAIVYIVDSLDVPYDNIAIPPNILLFKYSPANNYCCMRK